MIAGRNILRAIWGRSGHFLPPVREPILLYRSAHIISVFAAILVWHVAVARLVASPLALMLASGMIFLIALVVHQLLASWLTLRCPSDPNLYLAGPWISTEARRELRKGRMPGASGPKSVAQFFCNNGRDVDRTWTSASRRTAELLLVAGYVVLIFSATATVTAIWVLASEQYAGWQKPRAGTEKTATIPTDLLFGFGKAELASGAVETLDGLARRLRNDRAIRIEIEGHTDSRGSAETNQILSERRAAAVEEWLADNACIGNAKITARGYGETKGIAPNVRSDGSDNPEGRARNRRVEIRYETGPDRSSLRAGAAPCIGKPAPGP